MAIAGRENAEIYANRFRRGTPRIANQRLISRLIERTSPEAPGEGRGFTFFLIGERVFLGCQVNQVWKTRV